MDKLEEQQAVAIAPLLGIGCSSGDTVVGLSSLRRTEKLAYIFADAALAERTLRELEEWQKKGACVFGLEEFTLLTRAFGREDARVVGVKRGSLAKGIKKRLNKGNRSQNLSSGG
ncbi:MAG: hypothetical protein ACKVJG_12195 [Candidatus Latescibacterota bacterium]|jgi:hypothetical protein